MNNANLAKLALRFAVGNNDIPTTLVGSASPDRMKQNVAWLDEPIDEELLQDVRQLLEPIKDRPWESGLEENN